MSTSIPRKLIEVALPLEAINQAADREKKNNTGHPKMLHLWWARRPLPTARAVLWASLVDDPASRPDLFPDEQAQQAERARLHGILRELVKRENGANQALLSQARAEITKSMGERLPEFLDPFAGGGRSLLKPSVWG